MAYMLKVGESTIQRIFVGWIVFLETIFTYINPMPEAGFLLKKMPDIFVKTGHGLTDMIIDCTEFKFQHVSNLDLNSHRQSLHWNCTKWDESFFSVIPTQVLYQITVSLKSQGLSSGFNQNMN